jgi:hypothetical protein
MLPIVSIPEMTAADSSNSPSRPAAKILPMNTAYRPCRTWLGRFASIADCRSTDLATVG